MALHKGLQKDLPGTTSKGSLASSFPYLTCTTTWPSTFMPSPVYILSVVSLCCKGISCNCFPHVCSETRLTDVPISTVVPLLQVYH